MDIVQTAQDKSPVPSETAGDTLADNRTLPPDAEGQPCVSRTELLVYLQATETDDKGMRHKQVNIIPLQSSWLRDVGFEQGDAHRERKPCIGAHEHRHDPTLQLCVKGVTLTFIYIYH